jgi:hypothetical protein
MATQINVTVTPGNPKANKDVPCQLQVAPPQYLVDDAIWLDPGQAYDITFNLVGGVARTWSQQGSGENPPFCNTKGQCPDTSVGAQYGFTVTPGGPNKITVNVPSQGQSGTRAVQHYRMNFDNGYTCDPIIIIG